MTAVDRAITRAFQRLLQITMRRVATKAKDVHVSVNNHAEDFAPKAAIALRRLLGQCVRAHLPERPKQNDSDDEQLSLLG